MSGDLGKVSVVHILGTAYAIWRDHVKNVLPYHDCEGNPVYWFVEDLEYQEILVCDVETRTEALRAAEKIIRHRLEKVNEH